MKKITFIAFIVVSFSFLSSSAIQWKNEYAPNRYDYTSAASDTEVEYWAKSYREPRWEWERGKEIIEKTDGSGYIIGGFSYGGSDIWILDLSLSGDINWQRSYGGPLDLDVQLHGGIQETMDGGYIVGGINWAARYSLLKLNSFGDIEWQRAYGRSSMESSYSIQQTLDGGYIVAGTTESFGAGKGDFWISKLTSFGDIEWQRAYGGSSDDRAISIRLTEDGGYIVIGSTESFGAGKGDFWILKLSSFGDIEWQRTYGGSEDEWPGPHFQQTRDGGYIVAGTTESFGVLDQDSWILKLSSFGDIEWQRTYGGSGLDWGRCAKEIKDGGYIVSGTITSYDWEDNNGWILKLASSGNIEWQRTYGGDADVRFEDIKETSDGGYIVTSDYMASGPSADPLGEGVWMLKLPRNGNIPSSELMGSHDAILTDTNVSPSDTNVMPVDTSVTPMSINIESQETNASTYIECSWTGFTPAHPKRLKAIPMSWNKIKIEWEDKSTIEKGFRIERKTREGEWEAIETLEPNKKRYRDKGLKANKLYKYRVQAFNKNGYSAYSNKAKARTKKR